MAVPGFQEFMRPFLEELAAGKTRSMQEMTEAVACRLGLSEEDREELLPSGTQRVYSNRIAWTRTYLKKSGLVESPSRGNVRITPEGAITLKSHTGPIDIKFLSRFPAFVEFHQKGATATGGKIEADPRQSDQMEEKTPEEVLQQAYQSLRNALAEELLARVKLCSPDFFERLVVELIVSMGYGGSLSDAGRAVGRTGDGGIDGIIKEDRLGLDVIYIQAKRWSDSVGRPEIQKFSGALDGQRARKGIFITTSSFSKEAREFAAMIEKKIILIDGAQLSSLMMDFDVGVAPVSRFEVKKLDLDYFEES